MSVFADTTAFYALVDVRDANHQHAIEKWRFIAEEETRLVTHSLVLAESVALVQARAGIDGIRHLVPFLESADTVWIGPEEHGMALAAVLGSGRRQISLVDHASFHVMRNEGIRRAFAFDRHFSREGFELV